ncbi:putative serine/threonine-protein kinase BUD32 [Rozella allomycis CSF55]|uniref:non-specific serine/threonine protein kinase n=1 Tax=Rozella allomycis (strain CSF55) TaxID=988480 RepID=A0A075ATN3_ROZAC|nr:Protein kinase-like domain-containing protein [Rozella allomycis CSF55]RKP21748.1 putative serine/threonine-protein kinase BUD32 [Rozella allomycis CSF55]|eukprot:EPZ33535.1 Protein kinase-like domain-containing protein [Rozella allomycis CSF55]
MLISQGAEASTFTQSFKNFDKIILKKRESKNYRHHILDQNITKSRLSQEAKLLVKAASCDVRTPVLYWVDTQESILAMEHISGRPLKSCISSHAYLAESIGESIAKLHSCDIIHGDLTTSNILVENSSNEIVFIDFGLGYISSLAEDKAVDLYVLERAFDSSHPNDKDFFETIISSYFKKVSNPESIVIKLEEVRLRGRKRSMIG